MHLRRTTSSVRRLRAGSEDTRVDYATAAARAAVSLRDTVADRSIQQYHPSSSRWIVIDLLLAKARARTLCRVAPQRA
jgi:hypothetical protein